ncbi:MAG: ATP-binding protein [Acidimicrobiales bacterium]
MEARRRFPQELDSVGEARRFLRQVLEEWGLRTDPDPSILALSEVVTNAIVHGRSDAEVLVSIRGRTLRVEVRDVSAQRAVRKRYGPQAGTGRGLGIVEALAERWGTEGTGTGKVVWFELPLTEGAVSPVDTAEERTARPQRAPRGGRGRGGEPAEGAGQPRDLSSRGARVA